MSDSAVETPTTPVVLEAGNDDTRQMSTDCDSSAGASKDKSAVDTVQHPVQVIGCNEPKTPLAKRGSLSDQECASPLTPACCSSGPVVAQEEDSKVESAPCSADSNGSAKTMKKQEPDVNSDAVKTPAPPAKECEVVVASPITPEGNTIAQEEDNEVPTPNPAEKIKLKTLSPTAEPFVMSSSQLFPETPKKMAISHIPVSTIDVSGGLPPVTPNRHRGSPRTNPNAPVSPNVELSAKQVRELRRLCRKTANRAEYEGRLVQLRQIASILAMGGPSLVHFAPSYLAAHSAMQAWLDAARSGGADWRDERQLSIAAVEELREWDRLLKAWAKRRFPTLADVDGGSAPPTTPRSKRTEIMNVSSPVSGNSPTPARALVSSQQIGSPSNRTRNVLSSPGGAVQSRMSISTDGDTINVSIVRTPDKPPAKSTWRNVVTPRRDQENVYPETSDSPRDWGSLRKTSTASDAAASTPLKSRNW